MPRLLRPSIQLGSSPMNQVCRCTGSKAIEIVTESTRTRDEKSIYARRRPRSPPKNEIIKSRDRRDAGVVTHSEDNVAVSEVIFSMSANGGHIAGCRVLLGWRYHKHRGQARQIPASRLHNLLQFCTENIATLTTSVLEFG
jgi:hypothetical protein